MKKFLASLLVLALCAPAMAATILVTDNADLTATVTVSSTGTDTNLVGLALDVDVDAGSVTAVTINTANFNIYPDAGYTQELGAGYVYGTGTPVAAKAAAGQIALPLSSFALSFGNLNGPTTSGASGAAVVTITLTLSESATLTVCENALRGGLVSVTGQSLVATCGEALITGTPPGGCTSCIGDVNGDGVIDLFNDALTIILALDAVGYADITPIPAGLECADTNADGVIDLFNDALTVILQLDAVGYSDIPCP